MKTAWICFDKHTNTTNLIVSDLKLLTSSNTYSLSLSFHHPRRGQISSKPKKVLYGTAFHLASKKEEAEILNFYEDFLFCEVFNCTLSQSIRTVLFWNTRIWQTKPIWLEQVRVNGQSARPFPQQMQFTIRWSCDQVVLKAIGYIPTIYPYRW